MSNDRLDEILSEIRRVHARLDVLSREQQLMLTRLKQLEYRVAAGQRLPLPSIAAEPIDPPDDLVWHGGPRPPRS